MLKILQARLQQYVTLLDTKMEEDSKGEARLGLMILNINYF